MTAEQSQYLNYALQAAVVFATLYSTLCSHPEKVRAHWQALRRVVDLLIPLWVVCYLGYLLLIVPYPLSRIHFISLVLYFGLLIMTIVGWTLRRIVSKISENERETHECILKIQDQFQQTLDLQKTMVSFMETSNTQYRDEMNLMSQALQKSMSGGLTQKGTSKPKKK